MLQTAVDKVNQEGLRVGFDLPRLKDIIADAGVASSAAYQIRSPPQVHLKHLRRSEEVLDRGNSPADAAAAGRQNERNSLSAAYPG